ncbi:lipopolysaccharide biosynthesis protein [Arthrobacter sp. U41]|uniref:lipopolysaccharide biosynthesis protein n=1 Tax=Arthrobacter sp. U41 TaxID=1849032 RepID=UPI0008596975|nr:lipopolysaccharide biosynthesis protein [Arthrobacter sp. U41]AOT02279.1 hypothetical protein ASPU41_01880 [Arthrobacter sp. U41]
MTTSTAHRAARGGLVTLAGQAIKMVLLLLNLVVLGRLLTPEDFGLVAMVTAVVGMAELVRDFGITTASIQSPTLSMIQKNNLFWINSALGLGLAVVAALLSHPLVLFYGDSRLVPITLAISSVFLINGIQAQYQVELTRSLRFKALALTDISSNAVALGAAVAAASLGAGYWSLVIMQLTSALLLLISRMFVSEWHPGMPGRNGQVRKFLRYGGNLGVAQFLNYISANAPSVLMGYAYGASALGSYSRASQIATIPVNQVFGPLTNVALTTLVRITDNSAFNRAVGIMQILLGYTASLGSSFLVVFSAPIIHLLLGDKWGSVSPLLQILAVGITFQAATFVSYWVFLAKDRTVSLLRYNLLTKSIVLSLTLVGGFFGVEEMVWGYTAGLILAWPISVLWLRTMGVPSAIPLSGGLRFIGLGLVATMGGLLMPLTGVVELPVLASAIGWSVGLVVPLLFPQTRMDLRVIFMTMRQLIRPKPSIKGN